MKKEEVRMEAAVIHLFINTMIASFIGALILKVAVKLVQKLRIAYWDAYLTVFLAGIVNIFMGLAAGLSMGRVVLSITVLCVIIPVMLSAQFLIQAGFISLRANIPFGRACLVTLVMVGIILIIAAVLFAPLFIMSHAFSN